MSVIYNEKLGLLTVELPCTSPTGKVRVKERNLFFDYGQPIASRQNKMNNKCYLEWQIGFDLEANYKNFKLTSIKDKLFTNHKGVNKVPYELAEILFYSEKLNFLSMDEIRKCYKEMKSFNYHIDEENIIRTYPKEIEKNDIKFYEMQVSYPLFVHKFFEYDRCAEIMVKEKQRAVGVQPMLYVCIPITNLKFKKEVIGRVLDIKETGVWVIEKNEAHLVLELFKIFAMLSKKHQFDVCEIFKVLFKL